MPPRVRSKRPGSASARLIAGRLPGVASTVRTKSPQFYGHWQLPAGARVSLPAEYPERAVYVARGMVEVDGQRIAEVSMAVLLAAGQRPLLRSVKRWSWP